MSKEKIDSFSVEIDITACTKPPKSKLIVIIAILMLALTGAAFGQSGVSCSNLSHLQKTVCSATDGDTTTYSVGVLNQYEASLHTISLNEYLALEKSEMAEIRVESNRLDAQREASAKQWAKFQHDQTCSSYTINFMSKKAKKKFLADNNCSEVK